MTMRKTPLSVLAVSVVALLTAQTAVAAERTHVRKTDRATATEQFRNSNAFAAPANIAIQEDWSRYSSGGGMSAPAGH
jgi:outer membrane biogenesis lipoprotein LolB